MRYGLFGIMAAAIAASHRLTGISRVEKRSGRIDGVARDYKIERAVHRYSVVGSRFYPSLGGGKRECERRLRQRRDGILNGPVYRLEGRQLVLVLAA